MSLSRVPRCVVEIRHRFAELLFSQNQAVLHRDDGDREKSINREHSLLSRTTVAATAAARLLFLKTKTPHTIEAEMGKATTRFAKFCTSDQLLAWTTVG